MRDSLSPNGTDNQFGMVWEGTDNEDGSRGDPELTVFAGGPSADRVNSSDPDQHFRAGLEKLYKGFGNEVGNTTPVNWTTKEWTMGGYSCPSIGQVTTAAKALYNPMDGSFGPESTRAWLSSVIWNRRFNPGCTPPSSSQSRKKFLRSKESAKPVFAVLARPSLVPR